MSNDNTCTIIGRLSRDPEIRYLTNGTAVCSFGLAWSPRTKNKDTGEWEDGDPSFYNCTAWRQLGENVAASFSKGDRVIVIGPVSVRPWEDRDGNKRTSVEIDVQECGPSVRFQPATSERQERSSGTTSRQSSPYEGEEPPF